MMTNHYAYNQYKYPVAYKEIKKNQRLDFYKRDDNHDRTDSEE